MSRRGTSSFEFKFDPFWKNTQSFSSFSLSDRIEEISILPGRKRSVCVWLTVAIPRVVSEYLARSLDSDLSKASEQSNSPTLIRGKLQFNCFDLHGRSLVQLVELTAHIICSQSSLRSHCFFCSHIQTVFIWNRINTHQQSNSAQIHVHLLSRLRKAHSTLETAMLEFESLQCWSSETIRFVQLNSRFASTAITIQSWLRFLSCFFRMVLFSSFFRFWFFIFAFWIFRVFHNSASLCLQKSLVQLKYLLCQGPIVDWNSNWLLAAEDQGRLQVQLLLVASNISFTCSWWWIHFLCFIGQEQNFAGQFQQCAQHHLNRCSSQ